MKKNVFTVFIVPIVTIRRDSVAVQVSTPFPNYRMRTLVLPVRSSIKYIIVYNFNGVNSLYIIVYIS